MNGVSPQPHQSSVAGIGRCAAVDKRDSTQRETSADTQLLTSTDTHTLLDGTASVIDLGNCASLLLLPSMTENVSQSVKHVCLVHMHSN